MKEYEIQKTFYRTKGSKDQELIYNGSGLSIEEINKSPVMEGKEIETRRTFHVAEDKSGNKVWIKEYTEKEYGGTLGFPLNINYEYYYTKFLELIDARISVEDMTQERFKTMTICPVGVIKKRENEIAFEYLEGYKSIRGHEDRPWYSEAMQRLAEWTSTFPVSNYDMCENNTLVYENQGNISIKLIDFEYSDDRDPRTEPNPMKVTARVPDVLSEAMKGNLQAFDVRHQKVLSKVQQYDNILEIGVGTGKSSAYLKAIGKDVTMQDFDASPDYVGPEIENAVIHNADVTVEDTWEENKFECVFACEMIEHVEDYKKAVNNMIKWASKKVVITTPLGQSYFDPDHKHFFKDSDFTFISKTHRIERIITKRDDIMSGQRCLYIEIDI